MPKASYWIKQLEDIGCTVMHIKPLGLYQVTNFKLKSTWIRSTKSAAGLQKIFQDFMDMALHINRKGNGNVNRCKS